MGRLLVHKKDLEKEKGINEITIEALEKQLKPLVALRDKVLSELDEKAFEKDSKMNTIGAEHRSIVRENHILEQYLAAKAMKNSLE